MKASTVLEQWFQKFPLTQQQTYMQQALTLASEAGQAGEVPVGAVVVNPAGQVISTGQNRRERDHDPTAHAEVIALRRAGQVLGNWHLADCALFVTLEPCPMCAGAIIAARLGLLVYGTDDLKTGAVRSVINIPDSASSNHQLAVIAGISGRLAKQQLQDWFKNKRSSKK